MTRRELIEENKRLRRRVAHLEQAIKDRDRQIRKFRPKAKPSHPFKCLTCKHYKCFWYEHHCPDCKKAMEETATA